MDTKNLDLENMTCLTWNGKFSSDITQTNLDPYSNFLTSSRDFVLFLSVLQLSSSNVSLALCWASSASHLLSSFDPL